MVGIDRSVSSATSQLGDICDLNMLVRTFEGADAVVHTAALHAPHVGIFEDSEFERINVEGTKQVVKASRECGVNTLIFTSTTALYGHAVTADPAQAAWITEQTQPQPKSIYHRTKLEAETFLAETADDNLRITTLRMSRCFPEPAPLMAAYRLHRGVDARDVAEGHRLAILTPGESYRTFILSGATPFSIADLEDLKDRAPHVLKNKAPELCQLFAARKWELPQSIDRVYDSSLAQQALGWKPRYGFEDVAHLLDESISEVLPIRTSIKQFSE